MQLSFDTKARLLIISGVARAQKVPANQLWVALVHKAMGDSNYLINLAFSMPRSRQGVFERNGVATNYSCYKHTKF